MRRRDKKKFYGTVLVALLLLIGLGYAYIHTDLSISGDALFKRSTWNIHWVNSPTVTNGSVSGANVTQAAHVTGTNNDTVEYSVTLTNPRDFYEFTVTAENNGTMDGMISTFSNKVYSGNTEITLPDYVKSEVRYTNGAKVAEKQILSANSTETFRVRVSFRDDIEVNQLPGSDTSLTFRFNVTYVQADNTAIQVVPPAFNESTSWEDVIDGIHDGVLTPTVGDTKTVNMGTLGTHTLRVANTTTPAECSTTGFSQTGCGLVLEFADIIASYEMNPSGEYQGTTYNYGWNIGGWPASSMRSYVNSDIYSALPNVLKNAIIDTTVVSGHGNSDSANFTSTDKLYLLDAKEIYGTSFTSNYNTAKDNERQLDYYAGLNVTTTSYSGAIKQNNVSNDDYWWLRSAASNNDISFQGVYIIGDWYNITASNSYGVSPAFRIA